MIVRTSVIHDSRVLREAATLSSNGYKVTIIGMKDSGEEPTKIDINGIDVYLITVRLKNLLPVSMIGWAFKYFVSSVLNLFAEKSSIAELYTFWVSSYSASLYPISMKTLRIILAT